MVQPALKVLSDLVLLPSDEIVQWRIEASPGEACGFIFVV